jgi:hypothetical protein
LYCCSGTCLSVPRTMLFLFFPSSVSATDSVSTTQLRMQLTITNLLRSHQGHKIDRRVKDRQLQLPSNFQVCTCVFCEIICWILMFSSGFPRKSATLIGEGRTVLGIVLSVKFLLLQLNTVKTQRQITHHMIILNHSQTFFTKPRV